MANKVHLMRIKNKAVGLKTIPTVNRVYFNISYLDSENVERMTAVFVSNQWTIGRAIDVIAQEMKLSNNNNKSDAKKLRLFKKKDNQSVFLDISTVLKELLNEKHIMDGENLLIKYIDD